MKGLPKWFGHVNLNVRDLARAEHFYTDVLGMCPVLRLAPANLQSGAAFAVSDPVRWDGVLMGDHRGPRGPVLDVLQWHPAADSEPEAADDSSHRWGLNRLLFSAPDLEVVRRRAADVDCPARIIEMTNDDGTDVPALHVRDPDGTHIEVCAGEAPTTFRGVRLNCSSLERSTSYYERVLSMTVTEEHTSSIDGNRVRRRMLRYSGTRDTFGIELCEPAPHVLLRRALAPGNRPGLYRMALVTSDFEASLAHLEAVLPDPPRIASVDIGAGIGELNAVFFEDPDGAVVEFIEHGFMETARRNGRQIPLES